jgi:DNA-binding CsgD family transcriptional regulator
MSRSLIRLLDSLFAGVLEDPPWISFLEELEDQLPCVNTSMVLRKPRTGDPGRVLITPRGNSEGLAVLQERVFKHSPFLELPRGKICILHEMLTAETRKLYTEYLAYLRAFGTADLIGVDLVDQHSGMTFRLRCARAEGEPQFGARERNLFKNLLPRLEVATAIYGRLMAQRNQLYIYGETSERVAVGSLMLNENGEVLIKNTVADRLLERRDGLYAQQGILHCVNSDDERALNALLKETLSTPEHARPDRSLKVRRADSERHWNLLLRPAGPSVALGDNTARAIMVFIRDASDKPPISGPMLTELFGLTRAEATLAVRLVQGQSLDEAAAALGISRYTARAQLAAIFAKTDTHRQPQLVSLILNTVTTLWS